jgi:hypothetical protein
MERIRRLLKSKPIDAPTREQAGAPYRKAGTNSSSHRSVTIHVANLSRWTRWLGADDAAIYFTGDLSIYALQHDATAPTRVSDPMMHIANAAFGESTLAWNTREPGSADTSALWCMPTSGGTPRKIATATGTGSTIAIRRGHAFWVTTRHESDPSNDKIIRHWWSTIHVHDLATGEVAAPAIEREAFVRGFSASTVGATWIESPTSGPTLQCTRTAEGELRVVELGTGPASLRHGPVAIADRAVYLAADDGSALEVANVEDGTTTTFAKLPAPVLALATDAVNVYAITGRASRLARDVW